MLRWQAGGPGGCGGQSRGGSSPRPPRHDDGGAPPADHAIAWSPDGARSRVCPSSVSTRLHEAPCARPAGAGRKVGPRRRPRSARLEPTRTPALGQQRLSPKLSLNLRIAAVPFTLRNLIEDLPDVGSNFDGAPDLEFRLASKALELEQSGLSYQRIPPDYRFPYGHTHRSRRRCSWSWAGAGG